MFIKTSKELRYSNLNHPGPYPESPFGNQCRNCIHFAPDSIVDRTLIDSQSMIVAECRRFPPTAAKTDSSETEDHLGAFPLVISNGWCGEFVSISSKRFDDYASGDVDATHFEFAKLIELLSKQPQRTWTAWELTALANDHSLLQSKLGQGTERSQSTRMGVLASRFDGERFTLSEGSNAGFIRVRGGKNTNYRVEIID